MTFDCDDVENSPVEVSMYVWDEKGNADFCLVFLTLVDNNDACDGGTRAEIAGTVATEGGEGVEEVSVTLECSTCQNIQNLQQLMMKLDTMPLWIIH